MSARLRNYFFAGVLVIAPTALSIYLLYKGFVWADDLLGGFVQDLKIFGHSIPGLGIATVVVIIVCIGFLSTGYFGKRMLHLWETIVSTIPLMNRLYPAVKQIGSAFLAEQDRAFREPVLIEYPRHGVYSLAFSTKPPPDLIQRHVDRELISVFLPTTPNPTSGFLLMVPRDEIVPLAMTVEDALKLVISGGVVTPESLPQRVVASLPRAVPGRREPPAAGNESPGGATGTTGTDERSAADTGQGGSKRRRVKRRR